MRRDSGPVLAEPVSGAPGQTAQGSAVPGRSRDSGSGIAPAVGVGEAGHSVLQVSLQSQEPLMEITTGA